MAQDNRLSGGGSSDGSSRRLSPEEEARRLKARQIALDRRDENEDRTEGDQIAWQTDLPRDYDVGNDTLFADPQLNDLSGPGPDVHHDDRLPDAGRQLDPSVGPPGGSSRELDVPGEMGSAPASSESDLFWEQPAEGRAATSVEARTPVQADAGKTAAGSPDVQATSVPGGHSAAGGGKSGGGGASPNTAPRIGGESSGSVVEDAATDTVSGQLAISDPNSGQSHFLPASVSGAFGSFVIDPTGAWSYRLDNSNPDVQALTTGQMVLEQIPVYSADGTRTMVTVAVKGTDDRAVISGAGAGAVTEDGRTTASGQLSVTDADSGQSMFVAQSGASGTYGRFSVDADGAWSYTLDNGNPAVQALKDGERLVDRVPVFSADGTRSEVTVTVNGADDGARIGGAGAGAVTEDGRTTASGQLSVTDADSGQ
ncbi:VCBS domain-containing protein, partial [Hyphomonas sp.]|uniref:VCBS domain-containing protein n=1 Tax=Hyphomonas sp. TaxID=87 RepID=UPI0026119A43